MMVLVRLRVLLRGSIFVLLQIRVQKLLIDASLVVLDRLFFLGFIFVRISGVAIES